MEFTFASYNEYNVISLKGDLRISLLPALTPQLASYIQSHPNKSLVLDLSEAISIDSSTVHLFLNLKKKVEMNNRNLYIFKPSKDLYSLLNDVNLTRIFSIIETDQQLQDAITTKIYNTYLPYTSPEGDLHRLKCSCAVCGSKDVVGYLLDFNAYEWKWENDSFFPYSYDKEGNTFDFFGSYPIVCLDCFMTSIEINHFNILENDTIVVKSVLDEDSKLLLSKTIKKRKKMMEQETVLGDKFFNFPREKRAVFHSYLLAESCARTMAVHKYGANPFMIAYMNYFAIKYADNAIKEELINNCRTWLTQMFTEKEHFTPTQLSQGYYIMLVACLSLDKYKEAIVVYQNFSDLINALPKTAGVAVFENPAFWFSKGQTIWQKEIESKSMPLKNE